LRIPPGTLVAARRQPAPVRFVCRDVAPRASKVIFEVLVSCLKDSRHLYALRLFCVICVFVSAERCARSCEQESAFSFHRSACSRVGEARGPLPRGGARLPALPTRLISGLLAVRRPLGDAPARPAG